MPFTRPGTYIGVLMFLFVYLPIGSGCWFSCETMFLSYGTSRPTNVNIIGTVTFDLRRFVGHLYKS